MHVLLPQIFILFPQASHFVLHLLVLKGHGTAGIPEFLQLNLQLLLCTKKADSNLGDFRPVFSLEGLTKGFHRCCHHDGPLLCSRLEKEFPLFSDQPADFLNHIGHPLVLLPQIA